MASTPRHQTSTPARHLDTSPAARHPSTPLDTMLLMPPHTSKMYHSPCTPTRTGLVPRMMNAKEAPRYKGFLKIFLGTRPVRVGVHGEWYILDVCGGMSSMLGGGTRRGIVWALRCRSQTRTRGRTPGREGWALGFAAANLRPQSRPWNPMSVR